MPSEEMLMGKYDKKIIGANHWAIAEELAEANRLKKIEILYAGRAGNMTEESLKKLIDILVFLNSPLNY